MKSLAPRKGLGRAASLAVALMVGFAAGAAETPPTPGSPLNDLVRKFTEKRAAQPAPLPASQPVTSPVAQPVAQSAAQPSAPPIATAIDRDPATKKAAAR